MKAPNINFLIEANLNELIEGLLFKELTPFERTYAQIQIYYLESKTALLKELSFSELLLDEEERIFLEELKAIRIAIREKTITSQRIQTFLENTRSFSVFRGEILFICAMAHENINDQVLARQYYKQATPELQKMNTPRKALKAFHNFVAADSRLHPEKNNTVEWHLIYKKARVYKDRVCAASALNNLAREFQILGSLRTALRYSTKAVQLMGENKTSLNYHLALLNRVDILCELQEFESALTIADEILASQHIEVKSALQVIVNKYSLAFNTKPVGKAFLLPTWAERQGINTTTRLTNLEAMVIDLLSQGRRTKFDLIAHLYGETADFETLENRFKNLINRLRKKMPKQIEFSAGKYGLRFDRVG